METIFDQQFITVMIRLTLAMILGLIFGFERFFSKKRMGIRTYAIVSLTSALFIVISQIVTNNYLLLQTGINFDPMRVAAQIVVGIGFLGAGIIIFRDNKIHNLTTASGLWLCSAVGMGVGFGLYRESIFATLLVIVTLTAISFIEKFIGFKARKGNS